MKSLRPRQYLLDCQQALVYGRRDGIAGLKYRLGST
uniref:Uncharacterized protein n=2 Tax=unclassified Kuttervirus TaxID=2770329 RepID=A0AAU8GJ10_9CAUD